jgi:hypothetical protein
MSAVATLARELAAMSVALRNGGAGLIRAGGSSAWFGHSFRFRRVGF